MSTINHIVTTAQKLVDTMGFDVRVAWQDSTDEFQTAVLAITSDQKLGQLIGKEGSNVEALEHVIRLMALRTLPPADEHVPHFVLDINDYRKDQLQVVLAQARSVAKHVAQTRRAQTLAPMNAYQRRMIHAALTTVDSITTESSGIEPQRRVVIKPSVDL